MFKLIDAMKWEASQVAVAIVYADSAADLGTKLGALTLSKGSIAYLANGSVYVLGDSWTKIGG